MGGEVGEEDGDDEEETDEGEGEDFFHPATAATHTAR